MMTTMIFFFLQANGARARKVGFSTEAQALTYLRRFSGTHHISEAAADDQERYAPMPTSWTLVQDLVYPMCEHGLSLDLCHGPQHYMSADQERAMDFQYADYNREAFAGMAD